MRQMLLGARGVLESAVSCAGLTLTVEKERVLIHRPGDRPDAGAVRIHVDENPGVAATYDVMSIPTMIVFQHGVEKKRIVGARPKHSMVAELTQFLS